MDVRILCKELSYTLQLVENGLIMIEQRGLEVQSITVLVRTSGIRVVTCIMYILY